MVDLPLQHPWSADLPLDVFARPFSEATRKTPCKNRGDLNSYFFILKESASCRFIPTGETPMSDPYPPDPGNTLPGGIPAPPPPRPDIKDPVKAGPTYGTDDGSKKKRKSKDRNHPTDPYEPLKKKRGCCGCLGGSLLVVVILFIALVGAVAYFGPGRFISEGYTVVNLKESETIISTAPTEPTIYLGRIVTYNAPLTNVPVAIVAQEIIVSGDFLKEVSLTGAKVTGLASARFAQNLEVIATEFYDKGIVLNGNLTGRVMKSIN